GRPAGRVGDLAREQRRSETGVVRGPAAVDVALAVLPVATGVAHLAFAAAAATADPHPERRHHMNEIPLHVRSSKANAVPNRGRGGPGPSVAPPSASVQDLSRPGQAPRPYLVAASAPRSRCSSMAKARPSQRRLDGSEARLASAAQKAASLAVFSSA